MKGFCFWCGAPLDHHDASNPAWARYGEHEVWPVEGEASGVAAVPVMGKGDKLNVE